MGGLEDKAAAQDGLITRAQALEAGLTRNIIWRKISNGRWRRVHPFVYAVVGAPITWRQQLRAASLWAEGHGVLSHRSAAAWWRLSRFPEGPVELSIARGFRPTEGVTLHRVDKLGPPDVWQQDGFKITTPARTLVDLARLVDPATVRATFDELLSKRRMTLDQFAAVLDRAGRPRGNHLLREILDAYRGGELPTESELESRIYELIVGRGICRLVKQSVHYIRGRRCRIDFIVPGTPIVIEALGYKWHGLRDVWETDIARINGLIARGFKPLQWTWDLITERPKDALKDLQKLLARHAPDTAVDAPRV